MASLFSYDKKCYGDVMKTRENHIDCVEKEPGSLGITKVKLDRNVCIGISACIAMAPHAFPALDEEGKAIINDPLGTSDEELLSAAQSCPVKAIILEDEKGNIIYP
jgi:ferredoxin